MISWLSILCCFLLCINNLNAQNDTLKVGDVIRDEQIINLRKMVKERDILFSHPNRKTTFTVKGQPVNEYIEYIFYFESSELLITTDINGKITSLRSSIVNKNIKLRMDVSSFKIILD